MTTALSLEPPNQTRCQAETDRLRRAWLEGLESGPLDPFDIEAIKQKARTRLTSLPGPDRHR
ncbi:hypothetical protein EOA19_27330 [Mesorhizobium sp. M7A.F.Ca.US.010.02.1.1]|nr:hypothetical protein EOA19_27330 [Mesorhizobium sp. M7A.F.Ca.US.010.02.1.1]